MLEWDAGAQQRYQTPRPWEAWHGDSLMASGILCGSLASGQTVRHLTLDQGIEGSNPSSPANSLSVKQGRRVLPAAFLIPEV